MDGLELLTEKAFRNTFSDQQTSWLALDGKLPSDFKNRLMEMVKQMMSSIEDAYEKGLADPGEGDVYVGSSGVALLYLRYGELTGEEEAIARALSLVEPHLKRLRNSVRDCTFLCGDAGPLAVAAAIHQRMGKRSHVKQLVKKLLAFHEPVAASTSLPDELLYGRAGYLYSLLFIRNNVDKELVPEDAVKQIVCSIVESGRAQASAIPSCSSPLMYEWHGKHYLGAAHGLSGIVYLLLKVMHVYGREKVEGWGGSCTGLGQVLIKCVDYLASLRYSSGNYTSSLKSFTTSPHPSDDRLVHFCHGAPGFVYMFVQAYEVFGEARFLTLAEGCAEIVWEKGLLTKGYGLCHGVAGNAYVFLSLYKLTGKGNQLYRASQFATWCLDYGKHHCRTPDRPYSLYEGMAGTAYFLLDLTNPERAKFPGFEL